MATATVELPQHLAALERANEIRRARADLKRNVRAGQITVSSLILNAPEIVAGTERRAGVSVAEILTWQRGWGHIRAQKFLRRLEMGVTVDLHSLSEPRRRAIAEELDD